MQHNGKLTILILLGITAVFVWMRKDGNIPDVSSACTSVTVDQIIPVTKTVARKRTEFVDWGRDPFVWPQREETVGSVSNLTLSAIMLSDERACATINKSIVCVGDRITDKTVKQIGQNRVILTDGTKDYVLKLQE